MLKKITLILLLFSFKNSSALSDKELLDMVNKRIENQNINIGLARHLITQLQNRKQNIADPAERARIDRSINEQQNLLANLNQNLAQFLKEKQALEA